MKKRIETIISNGKEKVLKKNPKIDKTIEYISTGIFVLLGTAVIAIGYTRIKKADSFPQTVEILKKEIPQNIQHQLRHILPKNLGTREKNIPDNRRLHSLINQKNGGQISDTNLTLSLPKKSNQKPPYDLSIR